MKASYFMPVDKINKFMRGAAMNSQYGIQVAGTCGPAVKDMLPPRWSSPTRRTRCSSPTS